MPDPSPTQRLADLLLDEPVTGWAGALRADGWSWGRISNELYARHNLNVTAETLRSWVLSASSAPTHGVEADGAPAGHRLPAGATTTTEVMP